MGDGALSPTRSGHAARFRYSHCAKQAAYADWKASLFSNIGSSRHVRADGVVTYDFQPLPELAPLRQGVYVDKKKVFDDDYLKRLSPLSLALWYMDDANFTVRSKGMQSRTAGLSRPGHHLCRGHGAGDPGAPGGVPGRHLGHPGQAGRLRRGKGRPSWSSPKTRRRSCTP